MTIVPETQKPVIKVKILKKLAYLIYRIRQSKDKFNPICTIKKMFCVACGNILVSEDRIDGGKVSVKLIDDQPRTFLRLKCIVKIKRTQITV